MPNSVVTGKDLRKTLQTHVIENASTWNVSLVDRFCGHAPKSIMERHYFGDKKSRMVDLFRQEVTAKLDAEIDHVVNKKGAEKCTTLHDPDVSASASNVQIIDVSALAVS